MRLILFLLCSLMYINVIAQFNDSTNYFTSLSSIGMYNQTNDRQSWLFNTNMKFSVYKKHVSMNTTAGMIYGEQQGILSNRDFTAAMDFNRYFEGKPTYFWGLATYEKNYSLKINNRFQSGAGLGYNLVSRSNTIITVSDGLLYERSDLPLSEEGENRDYETWRNSFRLKFRFLIHEIVTIDGTDFVQHALSDRQDYILRTQTNFSLKLVRWLSFTTGVTYNKISLTGRENFLVNFGLTAERYF